MNTNQLSSDQKNIYKFARIARGLSINDIASTLKVSPTYIRAIEKGDRTPSNKLYDDYLKVLRINDEIVSTFEKKSKRCDTYEKVLFGLLKIMCK